MVTRREKTVELLKKKPGLSDREITNRLEGKSSPQQPVNQLCRKLEMEGVLTRKRRKDGIIGNYLTSFGRRQKKELEKLKVARQPDKIKSIHDTPGITNPSTPLLQPHSNLGKSIKKIVLISCVKSKMDRPAKAKDLYTSPYFKYNLAYAYKLKPDSIFILSAKYGLVELDQVIAPYEKTLKNMPAREKKAWAEQVLASLRKRASLKADYFIILAGNDYRENLIPELCHYEVPFIGLDLFQQLHELKRRTS